MDRYFANLHSMNASDKAMYCPAAPNFYSGYGSIAATRANLPHWNKRLTTCFATFRLADSLPTEKLNSLEEARKDWLSTHPTPWTSEITREYYSLFDENIQKWLDQEHGSCVLVDSANSQIVEDALWHFAGERYDLYAYVVMPNHVHVLFQPIGGNTISGILESWKRFTARKINERTGKGGSLWQKESFDTLVRSERHFQTIIGYIKRNDVDKAWVVHG